MTQVALVTGASRGIGKGIAIRLAKDGFHVAINDLPSANSELEQLREEITQSGGTALVVFADVSVESEVEKMILDVVNTLGSLDVVRQRL